MDKRAPDVATETPTPLDDDVRARVEAALGGEVPAEGRTGPDAACLVALLPDGRRVHEVFVFSRGGDALGRCLDYLAPVVKEMRAKGGYLPLDWEGRPFDDAFVFVRSESRDYEAEEAAAKLLGEDAPARGLG